jgi:membrane protease YdiL (CAAX protease family)
MLAILTPAYAYVFSGSGHFLLRLYGFYLVDLAVIAVLWVRHPLELKLPDERRSFALYTAAGCIVVLGAVIAARLAGPDPASMDAVRFAVMPGGEKAAYFLSMGLFTPAFEEVLYRGMLYRLLRSGRGPIVAALGSTLVFSLMHGLSAVAFVQGILLAWVYERSGSVWGPFAVHSVNNTAWFLLFVA